MLLRAHPPPLNHCLSRGKFDRAVQVEDGVDGRQRDGWRMCGSDAAESVGWAAETGRTLRVTFHSDDQRSSQRHAAQPDIGAWIRFARKYPPHLHLSSSCPLAHKASPEFVLWGRVVSFAPNPQPGGPGFFFLSGCPSLSLWLKSLTARQRVVRLV